MRDVATRAGLALGAAYYYFPSKEAMLLAFYDRRRAQHEERARTALAAATGLRARLGAVVHTGLDVTQPDRKLLAALARSLGDPTDPLSVFGGRTRAIRARSIALFAEALAPEPYADDLRALLAAAFWLFYLGIVLYFVHDRSPGQQRTRQLVDGALDLLVGLVTLAAMPGMEAMRGQVVQLVAEAGLLPDQGAAVLGDFAAVAGEAPVAVPAPDPAGGAPPPAASSAPEENRKG
jgi:AcrR family transcriptional regulator